MWPAIAAVELANRGQQPQPKPSRRRVCRHNKSLQENITGSDDHGGLQHSGRVLHDFALKGSPPHPVSLPSQNTSCHRPTTHSQHHLPCNIWQQKAVGAGLSHPRTHIKQHRVWHNTQHTAKRYHKHRCATQPTAQPRTAQRSVPSGHGSISEPRIAALHGAAVCNTAHGLC